MKTTLRYAPVLALALLLAGCEGPCKKIGALTGPGLVSGTADFTTYVAGGTSISAGWQSGGLVNRHQVHSFPALFAMQIGKSVLASGQGTFTLPAIDADGKPPLLRVLQLKPITIIDTTGAVRGTPINNAQATPFHNMAVPYAVLADFLSSANYYTTTQARMEMFSVVARGNTPVVNQVLGLAPTFISFEYGANEVLGAASQGGSTPVYPASTYASLLTTAMNAIHTTLPNTKVAIFNVPHVSAAPFFTTFKPYALDTLGHVVSLIGPGSTPLGPTDLVTLAGGALLAAGTGFPTSAKSYVSGALGNGNPLPDQVVLSAAEQTALNAVIDAMNVAVDSVATRPWVVKVDLDGLLNGIAANGVQVGATHFTTAFVTGGIFTLDGVHPNDLADALLCNTMIDAINAKFGASVPRVNPSNYATPTASSMQPAWDGDHPLLPSRIEGLLERLPQPFVWQH